MDNYYKVKKGKLPFVVPHSEMQNVYRFGPRDLLATIKDVHSFYLPFLFREAVLSPGTRIVYFFEENGYEYDYYAIFDSVENTITTNWYGCPSSSGHHVGSTCGVCGLVG